MELALNAPLLFEVQQLYSPHGTKIPEFIFHHPSLDVDVYWLLFSVKNDIFAVQILRETTNSVKTYSFCTFKSDAARRRINYKFPLFSWFEFFCLCLT